MLTEKKDTNYVISSVNIKKNFFFNIQHAFMIKVPNKSGIDKNFLILIKRYS